MDTKNITISLPKDIISKMEDYCRRTGLKKSSLIRVLIEKHLLEK